ncbi:uncharacterized protein LOC106159524 [Lingula anatina]|uniref:Uncharacterized protein LOC106159524 n=1 Tax=Lingula anatina TaxID=7574 RepID=A0A1S3HZ27_LINAN|nr:uncharacterized protein LOC106159524 [Lingula anatina]|eukprot:XP_013391277.1 uncharacterized protein LOC106159524 [Lingula anatina]
MEMILRRLPITWVLLSIVYSVLANGYLEKDKERIRRQSSGSSAVSQICDIHLDGLYSHPSDCHKYVQCVSGTPWEMPCPGGLVFKPDKGWCETGPCQNSGSPGPLPVSSQSKPVYSQSSTYSTQRQSTDTKKDKKQTPPVTTRHYYNGQSPSTDQQATDTRQKTTTVEKRPVSRTQQFDAQEFCKSHQGTFAHPTCGKYVVCNGGYAWELTCSHGLVFKESTGSCDFGTCDPNGQSPNPDKESVQVTLPKESTNAQTTYRQETLSGSSDDGERKSDVPSIEEELPNAIQRAMKSLTQSLRREAQMARDIENNNRHQYRPFGVVQGFLRAKPFAKKLSLPAFVLCNASAYLISRFGIDNHESETYFRSIPSPIPENPYFLNPDDPYPTPEPGTCPWPRYTCPAQMEYRTFDGSCNNLQNPIIGRSFTPLKRLLYPDYGNGVGSPRLSRSRLKLPSPRKVSMALHPDQDVPNQIHTLMVMQFGQTLDHDLSLTAISKLAKDSSGRATETVNIECGSDGCDTSIPQCLPIPVPPNDKVFSNKKCLEFVRSEEVPGLDCGVGPRQQLNQITSFLDASNVYGSTKEEADTLRDISDPARGRLKITHNPNGGKYKPLLPETTDRTFCMDLDKKRHSCFRADNNRHQYRPFGVVQGFLRAKPFAKKLSLPAFVLCNASAYLISRFGIDNHESETYFRSIPSPIPENPYFLNPDDPYPTPEPGTCPWPRYTCPAQMEYRTFDGSCNNLQNPIIGRSFTPLKRLLYPDYGNGVGSPRLSRSRLKLPSPRKVSADLHPDRDVPNQIHTLMVMQFGQTLDHDLSLTAISKLAKDSSGRATETVNIECGSDGCDTSIPQCLPIPVPPNDKVFSNKKCLEFVRSEEVPGLDCGVGPRQQLNQITAYIDGSNVYGSTKEEADTLRDISDPARGRLKITHNPNGGKYKPLLPETTDRTFCMDLDKKRHSCFRAARGRLKITHNPNGGKYKPLLPETTDRTFCMDLDKKRHSCFRAGDERANEHAGLASMHTLWMREHNRIEQKLHEINPQWQGEKLYQETRKIIGAMMQHITYNEFLPVVMGTQKLAQYDLEVKKSGYYRGYNANVDPRISNAFATAAFRFGHTLIQPKLTRPRADFTKRPDGDMPLSKTFFRSDPVYDSKYDGVDGIMRGMCESSMQNFDRFVTKEVTEHLFSENPPDGPGTDLLSLNLQRGREHGIPGYNIWREFCGLGRASTFNDLANTIKKREIITKLEQTYDHVDDIDLFTGGLSEDNVEGGLIGPVFACIIGDQFRRLRQGDRFWYENKNPTHFTPGQLKELKKVTLARVLCNNLDQVVTMQPWVMMQPFRKTFPQKVYDQKSGLTIDWFNRLWDMDFNARVSCSSIDDVDLTKWKDKVYS